jgi:hypothetical protein
MTRRARWVSPVDVERASSRWVTALGPVELPAGDDDLARVIADILRDGFDAKLTTVPARSSVRWRCAEGGPSIMRYPAVDRHGLDEVWTRFARDSARSGPLVFGVAGDYLLVAANHGYGDGHLAVRLSLAVAQRSVGPAPRQRRLPLLTAAGRFFGRNGRAVSEVLRHKLTGDASTPPTTPTLPTGTRPWFPSPRVVSVSVGADVLDDIRRWRTDTATDASVSAVQLAAVMRELDVAGIARHPEVRILFDCRRYLAGLSDPLEVVGNFVVGVDFPLPETPSPAEVNHQIRTATGAGRPLLSMTVSTAQAAATMLRRPRAVVPATVDTPVRARLTFSDVGPTPFPSSMFTGDVPARLFNSCSEPAEPDGIVVTIFQVGGAVNIAATFHDTVFDPATVREVIGRAARSPIPATAGGTPQ